jgi:uncharacterized RDD family membrane protein YckC
LHILDSAIEPARPDTSSGDLGEVLASMESPLDRMSDEARLSLPPVQPVTDVFEALDHLDDLGSLDRLSSLDQFGKVETTDEFQVFERSEPDQRVERVERFEKPDRVAKVGRFVKADAPPAAATLAVEARPEPPRLVRPVATRVATSQAATALASELPLFVQGMSDPEIAPLAAPEPAAALSLAPTAALEPERVVLPPPAAPAVSEPEPEPDLPLVKLPRAPRAPLSVRRQTPAPGRVREKYQREAAESRQVGLLERDLLDVAPADTTLNMAAEAHDPEAVASPADEPANAARRIEAAVIDVLFIGAINFAVVWLTLQRCDLTLAQAAQLPFLPLAGFLFLLNSGYLLLFTATNGQTVGKMVAGIRVVGTSTEAILNDSVTFKQAAMRALLIFPSVLALGAGFVPALLGERLALHDRFAHTRVIRA